MKYLYKLSKLGAWVLVAITPLMLFSGILAFKPAALPWLKAWLPKAMSFHVGLFAWVFIPAFFFHSLIGILHGVGKVQWGNRTAKIIIGGLWIAILAWAFILLMPSISSFLSAPTNPINNATSTSGGVNLTSVEIGRHNSFQSCWLIISANVYDVTRYLNVHPGSAATILPYCGKDGTSAFATKGGIGQAHSLSAQQLLQSFYLGKIGEKITNQQIQSINNISIPFTRENDGFDD